MSSLCESNCDDVDESPMEIQSLCVRCKNNGVTRVLLSKIPFYKEVILMSFECPHCGFRNNEMTSGGKVQEHGVRYNLKVVERKDLDRQVVKSEYAMYAIPEVELEVPYGSQCGLVTTVEGLLCRVQRDLAETIAFQMATLINAECNFTLILDDPSGNSFIENPNPEKIDDRLAIVRYQRTLQQEKLLGLAPDDSGEPDEEDAPPVWESREAVRNEVLHFSVDCPNCWQKAVTNMKFVNIPFFKEVVIMATCCDNCGYKTNEVKPSGGISDRGMKLTLTLTDKEDLSRDLLKSENCHVSIPELELEVGPGILASRFTTVEGLLNSLKEELENSSLFALGDSAVPEHKHKMSDLLHKLSDVALGKLQCQLILDDPSGNSYVESLSEHGADSRLKVVYYERSNEQNEELGLNQMHTDDCEQRSSVNNTND
ncbi:zinc finger protein ZPR1 [Trichuris trichiura]|uniref:Zinc finger protein ZPR1 n=1 Tax=Trichuris trichiura TaxID=36087 RepID=A0A077Z338_TRITR|nr:zinc finger protein ZPR1 [Trichuris trichiura]